MAKDRKKELNAEISKAMMTDFERVGQGFVTYWKLIAAAVVGIAVLVAAIAWAAGHQKESARQAREALSTASNVEELSAALVTYGGSPAASYARFRLAGMFLQQKEYDKAVEQLKLIGDADGDASLAANAAQMEAYALELSGKDAEAAALFADLASQGNAPQMFRAEARFAAGRLYAKLKDLDSAVEILEMAHPNKPAQNVADAWDEQSVALLRSINAGEYGARTAK